jgi:hypothetical protein
MDLAACGDLVRLDRRVSRALADGRGIRLAGHELELLARVGMIEQLASAKATALKEQAACRQSKVVSISEVRSGSTSSVAQTGAPRAQTGTSGGMIQSQGVSSGRARALRTFA